MRKGPSGEEQIVKGLMAVGEASCSSVHGANRLAGNNLTEELVFGKAAALATAELYKPGGKAKDFSANAGLETIEKVSRLRNSQGDISVRDLKERLQKCMSKHVGLVRSQKQLEEGKHNQKFVFFITIIVK